MSINKNSFDVALIPGARSALTSVYHELRAAEDAHYSSLFASEAWRQTPPFHVRNCPICDASDFSKYLESRGLDIVRCSVCKLVYSRNVYDDDFDQQHYSSGASEAWNFHKKLQVNPTYSKVERLRSQYYIQLCNRYISSSTRQWLDIGCGSGGIIIEAAKDGWMTIGIEPNPIWVSLARDRGVEVREGFFPEVLTLSERFDCISMLDVLEHVVQPKDFLNKVVNHLAPGGIVFIQVPNLNSLIVQLEGAGNSNFVPGHWSYFDPASLRNLAKEAGFEILTMETVISELDRIMDFQSDVVRQKVMELTQCSIADKAEITADWLHEHLLGYKLICVLRRL